MKKWFLYGGLFIAAYLVFLIATAPASLITSFVTLPKNISVAGLNGSIWQPKADQISAQVSKQNIVVENVEANVSLLSLLMMSPSADISFGSTLSEGLAGVANVGASGNQIALNDVAIELPASLVVPYLKAPIPVEAFGMVQVNIDTLVMEQQSCIAAQGNISWQRAAVTALDNTVELGNFNGTLSCQQDVLTLDIAPKNNLGLSFSAYLRKNGRLTGDGTIKPGAKFPKVLNDVLPFIGKKDSQGRYRIKL